MVKDMTLKVTRDRTIVEQIYELTKYQMQKNVQYYRIPLWLRFNTICLSLTVKMASRMSATLNDKGARKRHIPL